MLSGLYTLITAACRRVRESSPAGWELWRLRGRVLAYVAGVQASALGALVLAAVTTRWNARDFVVFAALVCCAAVTVEATSKIKVAHGTVFRDMQAVWYIAAAALLAPFYALLLPLALTPYRIVRMARGATYRRAFSGSACALAYGSAGAVFQHLRPELTGPAPGSGFRVVSWLVTLACCGALGLAVNNALVVTAIKLSDPGRKIRGLVLERDAMVTDVCQLSLAALIALPSAFSPLLLAGALPVVVLMRRFMMHAQLVTAARIDAKTGLLNAATWHREAELEVSRATRIGSPLAIAIADIDHFKAVNDQHGHLVGDSVLALMAATMSALLRDYDLLGRFGGEEFVICLPHTGPHQAMQIAERLRQKISQISAVGAGDVPVQVTISVGVASVESSRFSLDELIIAADTALYQAKKAGRNCVRITRDQWAGRQVG
jgi:diguanylate cyclase (GGDEF)-like protein